MTYKIRYIRKECIGAGSCAVVWPERFELDQENIADLKDGTETEEGVFEWEFEEEHLQQAKDTCDSCPVDVIEIWKDGKKVYPE